jgi:hypothetical protein
MARWAVVVWVGLAAAAAALLIPGSLSSTNRGTIFWILLALVLATGALAWLATRGDRRAIRFLVLASGALTGLAIVAAVLVLALSVGQAPLIDVIGWPLVAVGATTALLGSIWGLRSLPAAAP